MYLPQDIDALLFDLGGVIIEIDWNRIFRKWAQRSALSVRETANRFRMDEAYERHERGELPAAEYFAYLQSIVEFQGDDEYFVEGWNAVFVKEIEDTVSNSSLISKSTNLT